MSAELVELRELLVAAARAGDVLERFTTARPLEYITWTPPQYEWLASSHLRKLFRAGNQIGKTYAGLAEVIWRCTGQHPYIRTRTPPVEIWIVCTTWPQSVAIMGKFWHLLPKHLIRPETRWTPRWGFGDKNPTVEFLNGSIVRFRTTNQGPEALAGATIDGVLVDEPTDEEVYRELDRRLMRTGGWMGLVLTPINRPVEYLRQLVRDGVVWEVHARLTVDNVTPIGALEPLRLLDGTPMDQRFIAEQRRLVLPMFAPVVLDGEWETRLDGQVFAAFNPEVHVTESIPDADLRIALGLDHGEGDFREVAELAGVDIRGEHPRVHFVAEYASEGATTPERDAAGVLEALDAVGLNWRDIDYATGDKPTVGRIGRKSNADLTTELERLLRGRRELKRRGVGAELDPQIRTAKTGRLGGAGSVWRGVQWLHHAMLRPGHFTVHPRCERFVESLLKWDGTDNEHKDPADAARYATWPFAMRGAQRPGERVRLYAA